MKSCVLIPAYNESKAISDLTKQIRIKNLDVIVVDDGSSDNTGAIAKENGADVLRNERNEGKGASLRKGFAYALGKDFDTVVIMDGDGQHLVEDIQSFLRAAETSDASVFVGNRMTSLQNMPKLRALTNKLMSWLISKIAKQKIYDTQCGFRLLKKDALEKINLTTKKYEIETEILIRAARLGLRIESVPIKTVYRGEKSKINPFIDSFRFARFILRELWTTRR